MGIKREMPPARSIPPVKAAKTERTHEENQERAYIAASRRSDRSLEARVESARRASEIHKRRTGRSLRVTEQDVINEEMYEEEDDDLPIQYRRLTAHLQTDSQMFNRRLAAYLTSSVAMRDSVNQMSNPYSQAYPINQAQFGNINPQRSSTFTSPTLPQYQQNNAQSPVNLSSHRHEPYPSPHQVGYRGLHGRAYSTAVLPHTHQAVSTPRPLTIEQRRMSTPAVLPAQIDTNTVVPDADMTRQTQSSNPPSQQFNPYWQDFGGTLSGVLPPEQQQMLAGTSALNPNDSLSAALLLQGSEQYVNHPQYPWTQNGITSQMKVQLPPNPYKTMSSAKTPTSVGMDAPSLTATPGSATATATTYDSTTIQSRDPLGLDHLQVKFEPNSPHSLPRSGQVTPGESFWNSFVHDGGWGGDGGQISQ